MTTNNWVHMLARPAVRSLKAYSSARSLALVADIFLDANEAPGTGFNRYPEPQPKSLRTKLAQLYDVAAEEIFIGRGSDDAIDALIRVFVGEGESILICPPTYGVYACYGEIQGARVEQLPLLSESFQLDVPALIARAKKSPAPKLIFLCSPNNPTGNLLREADVEAMCQAYAEKALVVLDEAYIEFAQAESFARYLHRFDNLVVLRTLSKAHGLAGARCGVALAAPAILALLNKVRAPYPLATPAVIEVERALEDRSLQQTEQRITAICTARKELVKKLGQLEGVQNIYPSDANFLLFRVAGASGLVAYSREHGLLIRDRSNEPLLPDCVRVTIGTPEENARFLALLTQFLGRPLV